MFSDRPERIVTFSTTDFIGNWTTGTNSFSVNAPNDALIVEDTQTDDLEIAVNESFDPVYDTTRNALIYTTMTEDETLTDWPGEFGHTVLVIDSPPCNPSPNDGLGVSLNICGYYLSQQLLLEWLKDSVSSYYHGPNASGHAILSFFSNLKGHPGYVNQCCYTNNCRYAMDPHRGENFSHLTNCLTLN
jgi:hypothetical protein